MEVRPHEAVPNYDAGAMGGVLQQEHVFRGAVRREGRLLHGDEAARSPEAHRKNHGLESGFPRSEMRFAVPIRRIHHVRQIRGALRFSKTLLWAIPLAGTLPVELLTLAIPRKFARVKGVRWNETLGAIDRARGHLTTFP